MCTNKLAHFCNSGGGEMEFGLFHGGEATGHKRDGLEETSYVFMTQGIFS